MRLILIILLMAWIAWNGSMRDAAAFDTKSVAQNTVDATRRARTTMPIHGVTTAPPGYVDFCRRNPVQCRRPYRSGSALDRIDLTPDRWVMLNAVNSYINDLVSPETDEVLYGRTEHWTLPNSAGDCEDYVLLKRRELIKRGWPESAMLITVVLDEKGDGHAVLTVRTAQGDFVLDNKHSRILLWRDVPYTFIKRQSYRSPQLWVSLTPQLGGSTVATSR